MRSYSLLQASGYDKVPDLATDARKKYSAIKAQLAAQVRCQFADYYRVDLVFTNDSVLQQ